MNRWTLVAALVVLLVAGGCANDRADDGTDADRVVAQVNPLDVLDIAAVVAGLGVVNHLPRLVDTAGARVGLVGLAGNHAQCGQTDDRDFPEVHGLLR